MSSKSYFNYNIDSKFVAHSLNESLNLSDRNKCANKSLDFDANLISQQSYFSNNNLCNFQNQKQLNQFYSFGQNEIKQNIKSTECLNQPISFQEIDHFKQHVINSSLQSEVTEKKYPRKQNSNN